MKSVTRTVIVAGLIGIGAAVAGCTPNVDVGTGAPADDTGPTTSASSTGLDDLVLSLVQAGTGFDAPVLLMADPAGGRDFVVEQSGRIVRNDAGHTVALDISDDVLFAGERGLLGLAFHPDFRDEGLAYVNYVDRSGSTVIEEFVVVAGLFDVATRRTVLTVEQPAPNHNGGMIAFGPDGYLWIGMGDGGSSNDRFEQGQDPDTMLGAMLRIDVDADGTGSSYGIPPDNPFADGVAGAPEVWATGLRNPWRFTFDGDDLWIADVGQNEVEEINLVDVSDAGLNFGWPIMEGTICFGGGECDPAPFVVPVVEYGHDDGCSITGGYVYRGDTIQELQGQYFYSDFCSGFLRSAAADGTVVDWTAQTGETSQVAGFGVGGDSELYVVSRSGSVYRLEDSR